MPDLTPETISELDRLERAATPDKWEDDGSGYCLSSNGQQVASFFKTRQPKHRTNMELTAALRNACRPLLDRLAALEAENERLRGLLTRIGGWDHMDSAADGAYWKREIATALAEKGTT